MMYFTVLSFRLGVQHAPFPGDKISLNCTDLSLELYQRAGQVQSSSGDGLVSTCAMGKFIIWREMHPTTCESLSVLFQGNGLFVDLLQTHRETKEEAWGFPVNPSLPFQTHSLSMFSASGSGDTFATIEKPALTHDHSEPVAYASVHPGFYSERL